MTGDFADLLPWLDGYVVGQISYDEFDFAALSRDDIIEKLRAFKPQNTATLALVQQCPDFHLVSVKDRVMLIVDTDVVHVWQFIGVDDEYDDE